VYNKRMVKPIVLDLEEGEIIIREIKRHPIRLIPIFAGGLIAVIAILALQFVILNNPGFVTTENLPFGVATINLVFLVMIVLIVAFTLILASVDWANELVVTSENIIQVLQFTPFNRQVSQINLAKIQDVSVRQSGVFPSLFNYGSISIETAGEAANFYFRYAMDPTIAARVIVEAQEQYTQRRRQNSAAATTTM